MNSKFSTFLSSFNQATKGKQFEVFVKWFLENDPVWESEVDKVWLWDDYPDRWGKDCGIDLVFKDKNDEVWAVQAKCYDKEYPVTKSDVDKFLSESNRSLIQRRLLIATTDNLGPNARKVCADQEKPVTLFLYSDFEDSAIDYPESISELSRAKLKPKPQPRDHQTEAIEKVAKGFKNTNKGQLIMACGTGKTFTTLWIKEKLEAELTLILLPSLSLLSQTLKEWTFGMNTPFKSLAVCSDETVTKGASEDRLLESVQDLSFPVTSDPSLIADFLKSPGNRVVFSTYQSSSLIADAQKKTNIPSFDLAIADEAHRCAGNVASSFTTILNDDLIKTKLKLFTTATPRTYSSNLKKQAEDLDFEIAGMDDEKVFGKEFHRLSFGEAIDRKLLTDYQLVIIGVDEPMIAELIKHRELLKTDSDEIIDAKSLAAEIGLIKAIKDYGLKRVLSFHSRVKSAEDFSKELPKVLDLIGEAHKPKGKLATGFVSGAMPTSYRRQKLEQLKELSQGDYAVLSNARCLSEGVDVPALDGIAIIDPKASQIDIVQTVGRAIRLSDNKSVGTILLPVFIENGDDPELSIESTNFKPVWDVVKALRSHDEMLAFELDTLRTQLGRSKKRSSQVSGLRKIVIDVPTSVDMNFSSALRTYLVEKTTASWNFWFGLLEEYKKEFGDCNVPKRYINIEGNKLGSWVIRQRKVQFLSKEQISKLDNLNFIWNASNYRNWNDWISDFKKYKKEFGDLKVPQGYKTKEGITLGNKANTLRRNIEDLTFNQKKELNDLGFIWNASNKVEWNEIYKYLQIFKKEFGHCKVEKEYLSSDGFRLGYHVQKIRQNKKEYITVEEVNKLNDLGFVWDASKKRSWDDWISELIIYKTNFGNCKVPRRYSRVPNFSLGGWVTDVRRGKAKINTQQKKQLDDLGFIWDLEEDSWDKGYKLLLSYKDQNRSTNVPKKFLSEDGFELGKWLRNQWCNKNLSPERKKQLADLGFAMESQRSWSLWLDDLELYKKEFGDCNVPGRFITKQRLALGRWVIHQRQNKNLSPERKKLLDDLGFVWNPKKGPKK
ncbi:Helicase associated domain protein [Candidatus Methylopumilus planktonicus]|uniref:DEAD/DEAH box helicase n=1 Tax=Candidatus Methylopumilus planktonicus TaxID=1581557 RepID=UPI003BEEBA00